MTSFFRHLFYGCFSKSGIRKYKKECVSFCISRYAQQLVYSVCIKISRSKKQKVLLFLRLIDFLH